MPTVWGIPIPCQFRYRKWIDLLDLMLKSLIDLGFIGGYLNRNGSPVIKMKVKVMRALRSSNITRRVRTVQDLFQQLGRSSLFRPYYGTEQPDGSKISS